MLAVIRAVDSFIAPDLIALALEVLLGFSVYCLAIAVLRDTFLSEIVLGKIIKRGKKK